MRISRYPVRSEAESQQLIDALQTNLPYLPHARRFSWLYLRNPEGPALVWTATDPDTRRIAGIAAAFPRRTYFCGREVRSYVLGDFGIDADHRSLGLALALQRACIEGLTGENAAFAFDFPSHTMMAVYKRLHIGVSTTMVRYGKPLRVDRKVAERISVPGIARRLSAVVNTGLRIREQRRRNTDWKITAETEPWGEEFTHAAREWSSRMGVCVARTAAYLNWRFGEHPLQRYEMLTARQGSRLCGYVIHYANGEEHAIADLVAENDEVGTVLLAKVTIVARERRAHTLSSPWLTTHSGKQLLEQCGFLARESSPVVVLGLSENRVEPQRDQWFLTSGDREG